MAPRSNAPLGDQEPDVQCQAVKLGAVVRRRPHSSGDRVARRLKLAMAVVAAMATVSALEVDTTRGGHQAGSALPVMTDRVAVQAPPAGVPTPSAVIGTRLGDWELRSSSLVLADVAGQGLATLTHPGAGTVIVYRSDQSIRPELRRQGWTHIGDPTRGTATSSTLFRRPRRPQRNSSR